MSGCPNGCSQHHIAQHRVLRRLDQGRRAHDPRLRRAHRRPATRAARSSTAAPEGAPARQARARRGRALDPLLRGRAQRGRGVQRLRRARRDQGRSRTWSATSRCPPSSASRRWTTFIDWNRNVPVRGHPGRGRVRGLTAERAGLEPLGRGGPALAASASTRGSYVPCSFQKEESVILDLLLRIEPEARVFTLDTGVLFPETLATWRAIEERYGVRRRGRSTAGRAARPRCGPDPDRCCAIAQGRAARATRSPASTPGSPACAASRRPTRADTPQARRAGTTSTACGRSTRSPTGPSGTSGATSTSTTCPTTRCTTAATRRSAARPARSPGGGREGRWAGTDKIECGLHVG